MKKGNLEIYSRPSNYIIVHFNSADSALLIQAFCLSNKNVYLINYSVSSSAYLADNLVSFLAKMIHLGGLGLRKALKGSDFVPVLVKDRLFL